MLLVFNALSWLIEIYSWALIIYILMSWLPGARESGFGQFLAKICEPYLEPFRRIVPPIGMIDFSPIVAFIVLNLATRGLHQLAYWVL
ncbi:YggT family protein [Bacillus smithii]|jgi:YggT family protein|uniref:YggT family protein n=1 Tax=Bacillus smithii TaxID=1479 RepID=UPI002E22A30D|nr:YggT family protein [Bacillus smithii]MED1419216.1 YggT family protein [Bacillus smithii]MED1456273.1 YggT family protein [Bacillus smithii]